MHFQRNSPPRGCALARARFLSQFDGYLYDTVRTRHRRISVLVLYSYSQMDAHRMQMLGCRVTRLCCAALPKEVVCAPLSSPRDHKLLPPASTLWSSTIRPLVIQSNPNHLNATFRLVELLYHWCSALCAKGNDRPHRFWSPSVEIIETLLHPDEDEDHSTPSAVTKDTRTSIQDCQCEKEFNEMQLNPADEEALKGFRQPLSWMKRRYIKLQNCLTPFEDPKAEEDMEVESVLLDWVRQAICSDDVMPDRTPQSVLYGSDSTSNDSRLDFDFDDTDGYTPETSDSSSILVDERVNTTC